MNGSDMGLLFLAVAALVAIYLGSCLVHPYQDCPSCKGTSKHRGSVMGGLRLCHRCNGTGRVRRAGSILLGRGNRTARGNRIPPRTPRR
ncbi:hypothetical protein [Actinopolymorpha pittospori]